MWDLMWGMNTHDKGSGGMEDHLNRWGLVGLVLSQIGLINLGQTLINS